MEDLINRFTYHPPKTEDDINLHELIRTSLLAVANNITSLLPEGRERSLFITKIEEAMFWANASVARNR